MEGLQIHNANMEKGLMLTDVLKNLRRPSPIPGMEGEKLEDPVAQDLLRVGPNDLDRVGSFLKKNGITHLVPLIDAYGVSAIVLDAGDRVVRLSRGVPTKKPKAPYVLQPLILEVVGSVSVQISKKLETSNITQYDVLKIQNDLQIQGYHWDDAGVDNLGRDEDGNLFIIDGSVEKL